MTKFSVLISTVCFLILFFSCGKSEKEKEQISRAQRIEMARADSVALKIATVPTMDCLMFVLGVVTLS